MIRKILIFTLALAVLPSLAFAANDVTFPQASTIQLDDGSNYTIDTSSTFDSFTVNAANIQFTVSASSIISLVSLDRKDFSLSGTDADYMTISKSCANDRSVLLITVSVSAPTTYTVTVTPSGSCTGLGSSSPGTTGTPGGGGSGTPAPATPATPATPASAAPTAVASPENVTSLLTALNLTRNQAKETQNLAKVTADLKEFKLTGTADQKTAVNNFVTYGISASTIKLGEGERRAVIRDYLDTVKKADITWSDVERITTGQKPLDRNLKSEQAQLPKVLSAFEKITGHRPNFKNAKEDLAWNTMMYRVRFTRDLVKEMQGIKEFQAKIKKTPTTPLDWSVVRALGYALK